MSSKHTPGPWRLEEVVDRSIKHLCPVADVDGFSLLTVVHTEGNDGNECIPFAAVYRDADARLIAAAPELLDACRMVLFLEHLGGMLPGVKEIVQEAVNKARAAIAKAEGR